MDQKEKEKKKEKGKMIEQRFGGDKENEKEIEGTEEKDKKMKGKKYDRQNRLIDRRKILILIDPHNILNGKIF